MIILRCILHRWIDAHACVWEYIKFFMSCSVFSAVCFCLFLNKNPKQNQPNEKAQGVILEWEK